MVVPETLNTDDSHSTQRTIVSTRKPALGFIFVTLFLDIFGIGLIIPILPKLIEEMSGGNVAAASHTYGWLAALYSLMQFTRIFPGPRS